MRFRERHQDPNGTDLEYCGTHQQSRPASIRSSRPHSSAPWFVSMSASSPACLSCIRWSSDSGRSRHQNICARAPTRQNSRSAWRLLQLHLFGARAGGYQMFGITPMPIYDPNQKISYLRTSCACSKPGDIVKWKPIDRPPMMKRWPMSRPAVSANHPRCLVLAYRIQPDIDGYQSQARWSSPWPLRFEAGSCHHRSGSRTSGYYHIGHPALRPAWTGMRSRPPICWWATRRAPRSRSRVHGAGAGIYDDALVAVTGAELPPARWRARETWWSFT